MKSLPKLYLLVVVLSACALAAGTLPGSAKVPTTGSASVLQLAPLAAPVNLRLPANGADCQNHVYNHGAGYFEHIYFGCTHPTTNYIYLVWDYPGCVPANPTGCHVDGFHVFRTDAGRQDNGTTNLGTLAQIYYAGGRACWVVRAVKGTTESQDSNQFCIYPMVQLHPLNH